MRWTWLLRGMCVVTLLGPAEGWAQAPASQIELDAATRLRCLQILRDGFASDEFWPAMHAAEGLSVAGRGSEVVSRLRPLLPQEKDAQHRCGLARELARAGDLGATRVLLDELISPDPYGHVHACESLYKIGQVGDGQRLRKTLATTRSPRLAVMAAAALARWGHVEALGRLRVLLNEADPEIARIAAWVIARVGAEADRPALRAGAARFEDPLTRAYFQHALAALGDPEGRAALIANLAHPESSVRVYAAEFAPDARALDAKDGLIRLLDDPTLDVRIRAADALLRLASPAPLSRNDLIQREVFRATTANPRYSEGSVLVLSDGRLLYATTEFQGSESDFARARVIATESADGGQTWSAPRVVQENVGKQNVMSVTLRRLRPGAVFDGPIGLFYLVKNSPTDLHVFVRTSEDEARSFGPPVQVTTAPGYHVMNNDRVTILKSGRVLAPIASTGDVLKGGHFVSACVISDDLGKTWHHGRGHVDYGRRGAMEPEVVETEDGRLFMHIRTQLGHIAVSESTDGGETWGEARSWEVRAPEAPSTVRVIPSTGHLLLIWNDTFRAGEGHGGRRTPLTAAISADGGKTWTHRRDLETDAKFTYAYTSITFDRGRTLLTYYVRDEATGRISSRFRSLPIAWFYAGDAAP